MNARVEDITLTTRLRTLAARRWRQGEARTRVLALHGWLDNASSYDFLAPLLEDIELVALDLPGHGRSDHHAPGHWYHYVDYLDDVEAALDALQWPSATLLAHSLGGAIACAYAACKPARVQALWLIEALGALSSDPNKALENLRQSFADRDALASKSLRVFTHLDEAIRARMIANQLSEPVSRAIVTRGTKTVEGGLVWSSDPRLTVGSPWRLTETHVQAFLRGIECPTLLVLADPPQPYLAREMMLDRITRVAQIEHHIVNGTHHLHMETPAPVADCIQSFRQRHPNH